MPSGSRALHLGTGAPLFGLQGVMLCLAARTLHTNFPALGKGKVPLGNVPSRYMRKFLPILSFQQNIGAFHCTINVEAFIHSISVKFHIYN
jgi:hypothetical protein